MPDAGRSLLLMLSVVLTGCGFTLRESADFPPQMTRIYIATADRYTPFYRELAKSIRGSRAALVDSPADADTMFRVLRDETGRRALSVSIRNVPREFEIYYAVEFSVAVNGAEALEPQTLILTRDYTFDETKVLGKEREEQTLRNAVAASLVGLVRKRLSALR